MQETRLFLPETPGGAEVIHPASMVKLCAPAPARPIVPLWSDYLMQACEHCEAGFYFESGGCFGFAIALHEELSKIQPSAQIGMSQECVHCVVLLGPVAIDHQGDLPLESTLKYTALGGPEDTYQAAALAGHSRDGVDADSAWAREVIAVAKSISVVTRRDLEFPARLRDAHEIASHIDSTTPDGIDAEMARDKYFGLQAILVKIPTAHVEEDEVHADSHMAVAGRDAHYTSLPGDTAPPILLGEDGKVEDGHHRRRAAVARNDPWMLAYQLVDADVDLGLDQERGPRTTP